MCARFRLVDWPGSSDSQPSGRLAYPAQPPFHTNFSGLAANNTSVRATCDMGARVPDLRMRDGIYFLRAYTLARYLYYHIPELDRARTPLPLVEPSIVQPSYEVVFCRCPPCRRCV